MYLVHVLVNIVLLHLGLVHLPHLSTPYLEVAVSFLFKDSVIHDATQITHIVYTLICTTHTPSLVPSPSHPSF